jgi:hypothetical protein
MPPAATIAVSSGNNNGSTPPSLRRPLGVRVTRPDYYGPHKSAGGLGVVPRRGWDEYTAGWIQGAASSPVYGVRTWAETAPLTLLAVLADIHALAGMAWSNDSTLAFAPTDTRLVAVANAADKEIDEDGTAALASLFDSLPPEVGGLVGLQRTLGKMASVAGLACVEAVPGGIGVGLTDIATFSPLSVRFRDDEQGRRHLEQKQNGGAANRDSNGWKELDPLTCFAVPFDGSRDNPYGRPRYAPFLSEG